MTADDIVLWVAMRNPAMWQTSRCHYCHAWVGGEYPIHAADCLWLAAKDCLQKAESHKGQALDIGGTQCYEGD